jgi:protoporphyrinogen oxidase
MDGTRVAILGAGPAGLGAAWQLVNRRTAAVTVFEQRDVVGGNAGSFELEGMSVDYGSHRLHPSCAPRILQDIRALLGDDLLERPRHGRIRLSGRWIHFPLKALDLLLHLPWSFRCGIALDVCSRAVPRMRSKPMVHEPNETFRSVLDRGLGRTICRDFYFPYAKKIWGLAPDQLSAIQARRRVSAGSWSKLVRKTVRLDSGAPTGRIFYYPRHGYGQISRAMADAASDLGAEIQLRSAVRKLRLGSPHRIDIESSGQVQAVEADHIWSTIPLPILARLVDPSPPPSVLNACQCMEYRAMILVYLVIGQRQFTPFDAHYFPETDVPLSRLSEPKNYGDLTEPADRTVLCGELPCSVGDAIWGSSDQDLAELAMDSLKRCGLPAPEPLLRVVTRRLSHAYPIYRIGYEEHFAILDDWAESFDGVLTFGRQGLFAHDNTHHALAMAYAAADCLDRSGVFDRAHWREHRQGFAKHVVED